MVEYFIYGLAHPNTSIVRYVGKARNVKVRLKFGYNPTTKIAAWLRELKKRGLNPSVVIFERNAADDWKKRERYWVRKLRKEGRRLLNVCPGGNGSHSENSFPRKFRSMLGRIPDTHIAELVGLTRKAIAYHRILAGIAPAPIHTRRSGSARFKKGLHPFNKRVADQVILALVGRLNETEIAERVGLNRQSVSRRLRRLDIPTTSRHFRRRGPANSKLTAANVRICAASPRIPSRVLARRYGVDTSTIWRVRTRRTHAKN